MKHLQVCACASVLWVSHLFGAEVPTWEDCPRMTLDPSVGVDRLCENTIAGKSDVLLFQAIARLWLDRELPQANRMIRQAYEGLLGDASTMTPELADENAKWQMRLWVRTYYLFNGHNGHLPGRLEPETERHIHELFWNYAWAKSTVDRADLRYVWFIQGSENHDLMDLSNAFLALQAVQDLPEFKDRPLRDGRTAREHVRVWTRYYRAYADERVARGLFVECGSCTYGKYAVPELFNMADFAEDAVLRRKMTMLLDVLWADWAVEQVGGVRGGGKSRVYQGDYSRRGDCDSYMHMANVLSGEGRWARGRQSHTHFGYVHCLATSRYRLPRIVHRLIRDERRRGSYAYVSRRPAKMTGIDKMPDYQPHPCWYVFDREDTRAVRYTFCTPAYVMGSWWVDASLKESVVVKEGSQARGNAKYAAIHAQNRWQGIVFAAGVNTRVYPQCLSKRRKKPDSPYSVTYHQQIAAQHENVLIAQANIRRKDIEATRVYASEDIRDGLIRRDGWHMAKVGEAYVGFRGFERKRGASAPGHWEDGGYYRFSDWRTPVVLVAGTTERFENADRFAAYVRDQEYRVADGVLTARFADTDGKPVELCFDLTQRVLPFVNGRSIDLNPPKVYDCPYLQSRFGSGVVTIRFADEAHIWNMQDNSIRPAP